MSEVPFSPDLHVSSPLAGLIRKTSRRKGGMNHRPSNLELPTPPRPTGTSIPPPHSPILHAQFRTSIASASTDYEDGASMRTISWDARSGDAPSSSHTIRGHASAHDSVAASHYDYDIDSITNRYRDTWRSSSVDTSVYAPSDAPDLPTVIVSAVPEIPEQPENVWYMEQDIPGPSKGGRALSRVVNTNFSRPTVQTFSDTNSLEDRKREVLMRNSHHSPSSLYSPSWTGSRPVSPATPHTHEQQYPQPLVPESRSSVPQYQPQSQSQLGSEAKPERANSSVSVYSGYSFYELPPTPIGNHIPSGPPPAPGDSQGGAAPASPDRPRAASLADRRDGGIARLDNPQTPQDYLQLGITHHLENRLTESAAAFEKSATLDGGCGVGMLMWGLAQRHGWGCEKDEMTGFKWLRRAAELAVADLEKGKQQSDLSVVKSELVLAIYEVGQSFFRGWGVQKDKDMAVQYYRVAARLGDPDAQQELAFCLMNGKGCKKDKKEAAKWYRAAVQQGVSDIGLAWIYKEKYQ